jgi:hypothetical protein
MASIKVLYNNCYGGLNFSDAFVALWEKRSGKKLDLFKESLKYAPDSIRCDPIAISIFEENGSDWCSGESSMIALREFPEVFYRYWEIEEYDGDEHVRILVTDAFADILQVFMETGDRAALDRQYKEITDAQAALALKDSLTH